MLKKWSTISRLIGSTDTGWIVEHLLLDSLLFLRVLSPGVRTVLDFGAGAGLPGIPIKIVNSEVELTLLEGRRRRGSFLSAVVRELGLRGSRVIHARAEETLSDLRGSFDAVVMRCVGRVDRTLTIASSFVVPGGIVVASGPPDASPLSGAEWVTVPGLRPNSIRRFAVALAC